MNMNAKAIDNTLKQKRFEERQKSLAHRLQLSRSDLHWEQEELAEKSGISRSYISKLERGYVTNPSVDVIFSLADALGVSVQYLLGLTEDPLGGLTEDDEDKNAKLLKEQRIDYSEIDPKVFKLIQRFVAIFTELTPRDQALLLNMAATMRQADTPHIIGEDHDPK
jgi:transcriptional regulator with XRE-family HTH domain